MINKYFLTNIIEKEDIILSVKKNLKLEDELFKTTIINVEHHYSHLASSFFASNFEKSALLSIDGFGDFTSTALGFGINNKISVDKRILYPNSIGIFYTASTQFLGFNNYGDEYKIMGLAAYGLSLIHI